MRSVVGPGELTHLSSVTQESWSETTHQGTAAEQHTLATMLASYSCWWATAVGGLQAELLKLYSTP